jgi:hypothetical protein
VYRQGPKQKNTIDQLVNITSHLNVNGTVYHKTAQDRYVVTLYTRLSAAKDGEICIGKKKKQG